MPKIMCHICNGSGNKIILSEEICPHCTTIKLNTIPNLSTNYCKKCNGTGRIINYYEVKCNHCYGLGFTEY